MQIDDAIDQISEIHHHLARTEVYRGYRALPIAATGVLALAGGFAQPAILGAVDPAEFGGAFVLYWSSLAVACVALASTGIIARYRRDCARGRRHARLVIAQFVPSLAAGAIATVAASVWLHELRAGLPGVWSILFALGVFSSRPYLPQATGWVGLFYFAAGVALLWASSQFGPAGPLSLSPWAMGWTFGFGQLAAAAVLYWKVERPQPQARDGFRAVESKAETSR